MKKIILVFIFGLLTGVVYSQALKILPLGNSITQADNSHLSYRYPLWEKLQAAKLIDSDFDFDFVGSMNTHNGGTPTYPNSSFDRDHEGHWGWFADQLLANLPGWLANYTPDIVLLHAGSNDAINSQPTAGTVTELEQIIDVLRGDNPNVTVFIARLIPINYSPWNDNINLLNAEMSGIVGRKNTATSRVILVDQNAGFNAATDTYDAVHPNPSGEEKMAQKWYDAIITQYPLPITLLSFEAVLENKTVALKWTTASEKNHDYFSVQHSVDGGLFLDIDSIKGAGNSSTLLNYETFHFQPAFGKNYYRLKQTDFDWQFSFSQVEFVYVDERSPPTVYPNPATDEWQINFAGQEISDKIIRLFDNIGRKYLEFKTNGESVVKFRRDNLPPGMYIIQITSAQEQITNLHICFD